MRVVMLEAVRQKQAPVARVCFADALRWVWHVRLGVRQKAVELEDFKRDGYSNISGRSCPPSSMILSAGMFKRLAASRIASALGASYRQ